MIKDLSNWTEITKGLYRYVIGANCCYEIHILYHSKGTDILTAKSKCIYSWRLVYIKNR